MKKVSQSQRLMNKPATTEFYFLTAIKPIEGACSSDLVLWLHWSIYDVIM